MPKATKFSKELKHMKNMFLHANAKETHSCPLELKLQRILHSRYYLANLIQQTLGKQTIELEVIQGQLQLTLNYLCFLVVVVINLVVKVQKISLAHSNKIAQMGDPAMESYNQKHNLCLF